MGFKKEPPETRERLRQEELKKNPTGSLRDGLDRVMGMWNLGDATGGMGWKGTGLFILVLFLDTLSTSSFLVNRRRCINSSMSHATEFE